MNGARPLSHSVIVSSAEAFGYLDAAKVVPGVRVEAVMPEDRAHARALVGEHIGDLVAQHRDGPDDEPGTDHIIDTAMPALENAFEDPDAVFVRIRTPNDAGAHRRLNELAMVAAASFVIGSPGE